MHLLEADTLIIDVRLFVDSIPVGLAGDSLEEGGATRAWRPKHDEHLACIDKTLKVAQNVDSPLTNTHKALYAANSFQPGVAHRLLVVSTCAIAIGTEIPECKACTPADISAFLILL